MNKAYDLQVVHVTSIGIPLAITQLFGPMLSYCQEEWEICVHFQKEELHLKVSHQFQQSIIIVANIFLLVTFFLLVCSIF